MREVVVLFIAAIALSGCKPEPPAPGNTPLPSKVAWRNCLFELDKVEAIRGRNLNDLNRGSAVARNQFLMDCMGATADEITKDQLDEMAAYARQSDASKNTDPTSINLNNGLPRQ